MKIQFFIAIVAWFGGMIGSASGLADDGINFTRDIRPILSSNCLQCHGPDEKHLEADLRLDTEDGIAAVFRGEGEDVEGLQRMLSDDEGMRMPPPDSHRELKPGEIEKIKAWIAAGAPFESHWAFDRVVKPPFPMEERDPWVRNEIDQFIFSKLKSAGLTPNSEADRERLLRRVTFDLTGLPPTIKEINEFVQDQSPDAYEKIVDRLLASKAFGERMALNWMDAARYGDTSVFHADGRRDMWAWRDWVIESYNTNLPFDQFTVKQLAGDLIPNGTWRDKVASAFNRNHGTTDEGGVIPEEYRVEYVVDRVKTTSTVWLGLTMECGQCHSHKYDPISQKEYYQFFAFFNQTSDPGMQTRNGNQAPVVQVPNEAAAPELKKAQARLAQLQADLKQHVAAIEDPYQAWLKKAESETGNVEMPAGLVGHWKLDSVSKNQVENALDSKVKGQAKGKLAVKPGKIGKALEFNGKSHVHVGKLYDFERSDAFTLSAWINWNKQDGAIVSKMKNGGDYRGYDILISRGSVEFHLVNTWPTDALKVRTDAQLKPNQWQHVCVTYDGSSKADGVNIFFDGVPQKWKVEQDGLKSTTRNQTPFLIGQRTNGSPLKGLLDDLRIYQRALTEVEVKAVAGTSGLRELLATPADQRSADQAKALKDHYLNAVDKKHQALTKQIAATEKLVADLSKPVTTVMVMQEMPKPRMTYILDRGHYASPKKDEVIKPGTPVFLPPLREGLPPNRLGLAKWIVDPANPLTSRVTVNRYWQMFFGRGLVETVEDFGTQGAPPSHPELLDWLAADFVESGWNVKRTLKQIVMSATYRQSSKSSSQKLARDPDNQLISRGPRFRLMGEFIRDGALAAAGLLNTKVGGPSVKPYQPPGLWNEVSLNGGLRFRRDSGEKLYRKSMYIYWRRSAPMPSMSIFGTPSREKCVVRRAKTNTPLQALVILNDEQFVEAARFLAERVIKEKESLRDRIVLAHRLVTGIAPDEKRIQLLEQAYAEEKAVFDKSPEDAKKLLATGEKKRDESLDPNVHAAMTIVTSILLNLDEALTRG